MIKNMTSIDEHDLWIECSEKSIDFTGNIGVLIVENLIGKMVFWVNFYLIILKILGEFEKS